MEDNENVKSDIIYVGNLPKTLTESHIRTYFNQFGKVVKIRLMKSKKTGNSRGYCFVKFENHEIASIAADAMNNYFIDGRVLKVEVKEKAPHLKNIFKKGKPILSRSAQLSLHASRSEEQRKHTEETVGKLLQKGDDSTVIEGVAEVKARLESAIAHMEAKQEKLGTDVYASAIKKYQKALDVLVSRDKEKTSAK
ncbi:MKI67 FHA domain-interacting nucleolar phosphoprotein [Babesia ovis]|uniref:MKI67 FHA domain-interacting nucleolar phosphoprotein n=1 Tax=Babesia ovis TaxID=5869 RepID=A0A9W5TA58_BABOV|nr:MKI67 FHA domain-interacting nucleolar phosphoprotein [Babesia ovis]